MSCICDIVQPVTASGSIIVDAGRHGAWTRRKVKINANRSGNLLHTRGGLEGARSRARHHHLRVMRNAPEERVPPQVSAMRMEALFTLIGVLLCAAGVTLIVAAMFGPGELLELFVGFIVALVGAAIVGLSRVEET